MKRLFALFAVLLVVSSCASTAPNLASPTSGLRQFFVAVLHRNVRLTDTQIKGVAGQGQPVLEVLASAKDPRLAALLALALESKDIDKLGWVIPLTPVGTTASVDVVCPPAMAVQCEAIKPNTPVTVYAIPLPLASGLFLATRVRS